MTLAEILDELPQVHVLVFGDPMLDVYHFGRSERLSPEAPVPVFIEERQEIRQGGAANVAANLAALGCMVTTAFPVKPWTEKHRYMVGHHQLFRHDKDFLADGAWVPFDLEFGQPNVIVISDYNKGSCTLKACRAIIELCAVHKIPVVVDPKGARWEKYLGASVICPNEREWLAAQINDFMDYPRVVVKEGERGLRLVEAGVGTQYIAARARHVFDVTGAGDTVVAVVAAVLGAGGSLLAAATLANLAAGYVVGEVGTAVCPIEKLQELVLV